MMAVYCEDLNKRVLLAMGSVVAVHGDEGAIRVHSRCVCGRQGELITGRHLRSSSRHLPS